MFAALMFSLGVSAWVGVMLAFLAATLLVSLRALVWWRGDSHD